MAIQRYAIDPAEMIPSEDGTGLRGWPIVVKDSDHAAELRTGWKL